MSIESKVIGYRKKDAPVEIKTITLSDTVTADEILVKTTYTALNPADLKIKTMAFYASQWVAGLECCGIVEKAGANAALRFKPGDKVCVLLNPSVTHKTGTIGSVTKVNIAHSGVMHQPKCLDDAEAGGFTLSFATAWKLIASCQIDPEAPVLVLGGATSVGCILLQLLKKHYKLKTIVATCSPKSEAEVRSNGATETVNYRSSNYLELLKATAAKTGKFLNVYDCVGGYGPVSISNDILLPVSLGSTYISLDGDVTPEAQYSHTKVSDYLFAGARMAFRTMFGTFYGIRYKMILTDAEGWPTLGTQVVEEHKIRMKVGKVMPISQVAEAWHDVDQYHGGKIVLKF